MKLIAIFLSLILAVLAAFLSLIPSPLHGTVPEAPEGDGDMLVVKEDTVRGVRTVRITKTHGACLSKGVL